MVSTATKSSPPRPRVVKFMGDPKEIPQVWKSCTTLGRTHTKGTKTVLGIAGCYCKNTSHHIMYSGVRVSLRRVVLVQLLSTQTFLLIQNQGLRYIFVWGELFALYLFVATDADLSSLPSIPTLFVKHESAIRRLTSPLSVSAYERFYNLHEAGQDSQIFPAFLRGQQLRIQSK